MIEIKSKFRQYQSEFDDEAEKAKTREKSIAEQIKIEAEKEKARIEVEEEKARIEAEEEKARIEVEEEKARIEAEKEKAIKDARAKELAEKYRVQELEAIKRIQKEKEALEKKEIEDQLKKIEQVYKEKAKAEKAKVAAEKAKAKAEKAKAAAAAAEKAKIDKANEEKAKAEAAAAEKAKIDKAKVDKANEEKAKAEAVAAEKAKIDKARADSEAAALEKAKAEAVAAEKAKSEADATISTEINAYKSITTDSSESNSSSITPSIINNDHQIIKHTITKIFHVAAGGSHTCHTMLYPINNSSTNLNVKLVCYGLNTDGQTLVPPNASFEIRFISAGQKHSCSISSTNRITCWGLIMSNTIYVNDPKQISKINPNLVDLNAMLYNNNEVPQMVTSGETHSCS